MQRERIETTPAALKNAFNLLVGDVHSSCANCRPRTHTRKPTITQTHTHTRTHTSCPATRSGRLDHARAVQPYTIRCPGRPGAYNLTRSGALVVSGCATCHGKTQELCTCNLPWCTGDVFLDWFPKVCGAVVSRTGRRKTPMHKRKRECQCMHVRTARTESSKNKVSRGCLPRPPDEIDVARNGPSYRNGHTHTHTHTRVSPSSASCAVCTPSRPVC